jgi:O-antigen/teichoic acid export membrane protein
MHEADLNSLAGSLKLRLSTGLAAQTYNQAVTIGTQLISVPVLIAAWGVEQYGVWLIVSAIPAYLALADLGFAQVGGSDMTMRLARGDREGALTSYQTTFAMNCILGLACFVLMTGFAFSPWSSQLIGEEYVTRQTQLAIVVLAGHSLTSLLRGVIGTSLRAVGRFSLFVVLVATMRLTGAVLVLTVAVLGGDILEAAGAMLAGSLAIVLSMALWVQRQHPWLRLGFNHASRDSAKALLPASLHFLGYSFGNLISIQGSTIVIGAVLGPGAVALASTVRTLVRTGITAANMLNSTMLIEYAALFGQSAFASFKRLFRWQAFAAGCVVAIYLALMLSFGPLVYDVWTHGKLGTPHLLLGLLACATASDMLWTTLQAPSVAVNRMRITGRALFVANCLGLAALALLSQEFGVIVFGWVSIAISAGMLVAAIIEMRILASSLHT